MKHVGNFSDFLNESANPKEIKDLKKWMSKNLSQFSEDYTTKFGVNYLYDGEDQELYIADEGDGWSFSLRVDGSTEYEEYDLSFSELLELLPNVEDY